MVRTRLDAVDLERRFSIQECAACGILWTAPMPSAEELAGYYAEGYWEASHATHGRDGLVARAQRWFIETRIARVIRPLVKRVGSGARVLDVGCGSGETLRQLVRAGCAAHGVEASETAVAEARKTGAEVFQGTLEEARYPEGSFDGVTMIHVLEHVAAPLQTVRELHRILKSGGLLFVEVPNIRSWGFAIFGRRWRALDVPRHLFHFSPRSLTRLLRESGFEVIRLSHYSVRTSAAMLVGSLFPSMDPIRFRKREAGGRSALLPKIAYLVLQIVLTPLAVLTAMARRGDVIAVLARK